MIKIKNIHMINKMDFSLFVMDENWTGYYLSVQKGTEDNMKSEYMKKGVEYVLYSGYEHRKDEEMITPFTDEPITPFTDGTITLSVPYEQMSIEKLVENVLADIRYIPDIKIIIALPNEINYDFFEDLCAKKMNELESNVRNKYYHLVKFIQKIILP